ncbi:ABC transporter permease [Anaeromicropila herbilytica]|uniref:ABC transporter permease n=1 Tax=Anaeromicropila herbilytica TaxID=2785025 RepID=A0A7R7EN08_9FIRM|nr:ABC transporter permease [Anaeromicropila herbilytica]BCN31782.1 ABC transporter permease [Anaeromicropila herbilytica]
MWIKNFRQKKLLTLMIFIIIMLCSLLLNASMNILLSLDKPIQTFTKECEPAKVMLYTYEKDENALKGIVKGIKELKEVKNAKCVNFHFIQEELLFKNKKIDAFAKLIEYDDEQYGKIRYIHGNKKAAESLKDNECIIPASISYENHIKVGDEIKIKLATGVLNYKVKGIFTDPYNISTAFDSDIIINKLPKELSIRHIIKIYGKDGVTGKEIVDAYRTKNNGFVNGEFQTLEETIDGSLLAGNIIGAVFLAIGIIMLIVSCIIIYFIIRNIMITDAKSIAIYKTMGYTSTDILKMYLTFYFMIVSIACILGVLSSVWISNIILTSVFKNIGEVVQNNILFPGIPCYILVVSFVLLIIYRIINKTKKVKPVYAFNGMTNSTTKKKKEYKGNMTVQFSAIGIALRTLSRNKKSAISIILTSIVTIFSINFAIVSLDIANTMKDNNDYWLGVDKCDVMVQLSNSKEYEKVKEILNKDSRVDALYGSYVNTKVSLKWKKGLDNTIMSAFVYDDYSKVKNPIFKGRNPEAGNEIAITNLMAEDLGKSIGDYIEVYLGGNTKVNLLITGIFQTYYDMGKCCRLTTDAITANNISMQYNCISIYLKDPSSKNIFIQDMKKKIDGSGKVMPRTEFLSSITNMIAGPQKNAIPPVVLVVLLVGGVNIFCIVLLKNASNEKTNGIYKCLGYSTWHLICSNIYYVSIVAVASIIVAVPIFLEVYPLIMKASLSIFGFAKYPVQYNYWHIAIANIVVLLIFIISTIVSSHSLKKISARDLVQE